MKQQKQNKDRRIEIILTQGLEIAEMLNDID
jgi:hypothetical protein